ncbi:hypothetical protein ACHAXS_004365 [Conticribra weissflogii]
MKRRNLSKAMSSSSSSLGGAPPRPTTKTHLDVPRTTSSIIANDDDGNRDPIPPDAHPDDSHDDRLNYALLLALYTLQGIPMGLSASIPFLIQQKIQMLAHHAAGDPTAASGAHGAHAHDHAHSLAELTKAAYNAQAIFALCSWPFSLKLLWAPIVDACFSRRFGRRKSWLVPVQLVAGLLMVGGSGFVERELGLGSSVAGDVFAGGAADRTRLLPQRPSQSPQRAGDAMHLPTNPSSSPPPLLNIRGPTLYFFALYFLMATQDIAVDGWALTLLSKKNRGKGPICNSIGQNIGYFLSYVGFLALNDAESSETLWRPLLGLESRPGVGLVSLGGFVKGMGLFMLGITLLVGLFKREDAGSGGGFSVGNGSSGNSGHDANDVEKRRLLLPKSSNDDDDDDQELDAARLGIAETYHRLYAALRLPAVQSLVLILLTYRLPCALSDNVKFLKAVEFGLSKQTTALLSPTIVLPLGIIVPIVATKVWHNHPLRQFMAAFRFRVTFVALIDVLMLLVVRSYKTNDGVIFGTLDATLSRIVFWGLLILSTACQTIVQSLQFNAQMTFFASRVDPAIGGSYMTLLNTFANLGGTWPSSVVMYLVGQLTVPPKCEDGELGEVCTGGRDAYFPLQLGLSILGCLWVVVMKNRVQYISDLPDDAWRTHIGEEEEEEEEVKGETGSVEMRRGWWGRKIKGSKNA